jgi:arsenate reductase-like glutaredoxin family protein
MLANASVIKRPVVERDGVVLGVGFDEAKLASALA